MAPQTVSVEKRYRISLLLDIYGELLTEKQREFLRRYYEQDCSFGEIAREFNVSRQAIFDAVKHGEASLENYEGILKLAASGQRTLRGQGAEAAAVGSRLKEAAQIARESAEEIADGDGDADRERASERLVQIASEIEALADRLTSGAPRTNGSTSHPKPAPAAARAPKLFSRGGGPEVD